MVAHKKKKVFGSAKLEWRRVEETEKASCWEKKKKTRIKSQRNTNGTPEK